MKILNDKPKPIDNERLNSSEIRPPERHSTSGDITSEDRMELSAQALDLQKMTEAAKSAPDLRNEAVARAKDALQRGSYRVSAEGIAERLLTEETIDKVV